MRPLIEICVDTLAAAQAAARGGADRIELCSALAEGGLTPSPGLLEQVLATVDVPVHAMIRPRAGDFCYSAGEVRAMGRDIRMVREAGAAGVVLGVVTGEGRVDVETTRRLVELARPQWVTFHRAVDATRNLELALEDVVTTGADILLTSGGAARLSEALPVGAALVRQAAGRIAVMGGSGVTIENAGALHAATGVAALHASLRRPGSAGEHLVPGTQPAYGLLEADVRALVAAVGACGRDGASK